MCVSFCVCEVCLFDTMAEWSKALVLGTSLRAWVRIPLVSLHSLCMAPLPQRFLFYSATDSTNLTVTITVARIATSVCCSLGLVRLHLVWHIVCLSIVVAVVVVVVHD